MKKLILPVILALAGLAAGASAGFFLRPAEEAAETTEGENGEDAVEQEPPEYVKLSNQFVVPVLDGGRIQSLVVLSLSLEVAPESAESVFAREPKLRDLFLQILLTHANTGGFRGSFTDAANLVPLRKALKEAATGEMPDIIRDVLISDIIRQDS